MERSYELWDVAIGKRLARSQDAAEMASIIRALLNRHGPSMVDNLELYLEDEAGDTIRIYVGVEVSDWTDRVTPRTMPAFATN